MAIEYAPAPQTLREKSDLRVMRMSLRSLMPIHRQMRANFINSMGRDNG